MSTHIFGIRHHGPGSARSLLSALGDLRPDIVLVEGPPDANEAIPFIVEEGMQPPVALLVYRPDQPRRAVYYPFALFSPEWQALRYALDNAVPARFIDLAQSVQLAIDLEDGIDEIDDGLMPSDVKGHDVIRRDPLSWLAAAAGYEDGERWWEQMVEHRFSPEGIFDAIVEVMGELREAAREQRNGAGDDPVEARREAHMRREIRRAESEGFQRIAVVCGAWHAPALASMPPAEEDDATLGSPRTVATRAVWIPWTNSRLSRWSGYGAGIESPGWYHHLWSHDDKITTRWMARVASLFRREDLDASPAHIIEGVRLAEALAAIRGRSLPGLDELNDAVVSVFAFGNSTPLDLVGRALIVGETLGTVPEGRAAVPLEEDLNRQMKRLRLKRSASAEELDLDLRKPNDLERSRLLHRLSLLGVHWGTRGHTWGKLGTFHEIWNLAWSPEMSLALIESSIWGNSIEEASIAYTLDAAGRAKELSQATSLLEGALLADISSPIAEVLSRIEELSTTSGDLDHLMDAFPPLARLLRYSDVRGTKGAAVEHVVAGFVARISIGLPTHAMSLNDDAARELLGRIARTNDAIGLIDDAEHTRSWHGSLRQIMGSESIHGVIVGRACRILLDAGAIDRADGARALGLALSTGNDTSRAAAWIEGFVAGSGLVLLHDDQLWSLIDEWVASLSPDAFVATLPLLRRTFAGFSPAERRQMKERSRHRSTPTAHRTRDDRFDEEMAVKGLETVRLILGVVDGV